MSGEQLDDGKANADQPAFDEAKDHYLLAACKVVSCSQENLYRSGARAVQLHRRSGGRQNEKGREKSGKAIAELMFSGLGKSSTPAGGSRSGCAPRGTALLFRQ